MSIIIVREKHLEDNKIMKNIMRIDLIKIAEASEVFDNESMKAYVQNLKTIGPYIEATADDIEEYDNLYDSLIDNK